MKHPTQNTWRLVRELHASQSFWDKLAGRQQPPIGAFDEIAEANEALVIPHLTTFLLNGRSQVSNAAARTIGQLLANVQSSEYVQLDEACRNDWSPEYSASSDWRSLKPNDVKQFWRLSNAIAVIGVASFHGNGFVRDAAVNELATIFDGLELPFLLLRLNDWVGAVRESATTAVLDRIRPDYAKHFFRHLSLIFRLRSCGRSQHEQIVIAVTKLLQAPDAAQLLREGILSKDRWLRRESFRLAIATKSAQSTALLKEMLSDADPIIRLWAARNVLARLNDTELHPLLCSLLCDKFMPVRCEALNLMVQRFSADASRALREALLDSHSSVRSLAQYWIQSQKTGFDFASVYRQALNEATTTRQRAAILGLGETGASVDACAALSFLNAPFASLRKAAIRTIAVLDGDRHIDQFLTALADNHPGVSNEAARALASRTAMLIDRLQATFRADLPSHVRRNVFRLLMSQPFWARGIFLVEVLKDQDERIVEMARRAFHDWILHSRSMAVAPNSNEIRLFGDALNASAGMLTPYEVQELKFCLKTYQ
jgi:hypothetical protein